MNVPELVVPTVLGGVAGAVATIVIGFVWGGWVTGDTARVMEAKGLVTAVEAFTPLCVAKAEQQPEQIVLLKQADSWKRAEFVVKAGWVANVSKKYRSAVAEACASVVAEGMEAKPTK
jgi:hypothetical protein